MKSVPAGAMSQGWLFLSGSYQNQLRSGLSVLANKQNMLLTSRLMQSQQSCRNPSVLDPITLQTHMGVLEAHQYISPSIQRGPAQGVVMVVP